MSVTRRDFTQGLVLGAVTATGAPRMAYAAEPQRGGTLNLVIQPEPPILVSLTHSAGPTTRVSPKVTEGLVTFDLDFRPKPQLATQWDISDDGLRYTFTLRRNVKWHDGKDFTSVDVAHSIELLKQHHPRGRGTLASVIRVETPDDHTAVIVLEKPAPYLLAALTASESPIVPHHIYDGTDPLTNPNRRAPIGTGPFVFKEWKQGSHILLERNANYWDLGKPYLDRIVIRFVADANARAVGLETGEIHLAPDTPVPLGQLQALAANPKLLIETRGYDYQPIVYRLEFNLANPYFAKQQVRAAVAHAIDRDAITRVVFYGWGPERTERNQPCIEAVPLSRHPAP